MPASIDVPKIFISYSWKPETNRLKTIQLAERLRNDGVDVVLDVWDLAEGQDKNYFMEQMVNNPDVKRVLIICNKEYKERANERSGGVGTESLIISDEIYKQAAQTKFIPIILERSPEGKEYVPTFIHSRIYIDLHSDDIFEVEYEKLLRNIFDKPVSKKPPIGTPPAYVLEDKEPVFLKTAHKVTTIKNALLNEKRNYQVYIDDYYDSFIQSLDDFKINIEDVSDSSKIDDLVLEKIERLKDLRNDYITFLEVLTKYSTDINSDKLISFFERLLSYLLNSAYSLYSNGTIGDFLYDQFKFFYYEIFLYQTAIFIENEKFEELSKILGQEFMIQDKYGELKFYSFSYFRLPVYSLDEHRNKKLKSNRVSITADLIKKRADLPKYPFSLLKETDVLLHYLSLINHNSDLHFNWHGWLPLTSAYEVYDLPILKKMISKKYYDKIKPIFGDLNIEELKLKVDNVSDNSENLRRYYYRFTPINKAFKFDEIASRQ